jgi:hypothetical protein
MTGEHRWGAGGGQVGASKGVRIGGGAVRSASLSSSGWLRRCVTAPSADTPVIVLFCWGYCRSDDPKDSSWWIPVSIRLPVRLTGRQSGTAAVSAACVSSTNSKSLF